MSARCTLQRLAALSALVCLAACTASHRHTTSTTPTTSGIQPATAPTSATQACFATKIHTHLVHREWVLRHVLVETITVQHEVATSQQFDLAPIVPRVSVTSGAAPALSRLVAHLADVGVPAHDVPGPDRAPNSLTSARNESAGQYVLWTGARKILVRYTADCRGTTSRSTGTVTTYSEEVGGILQCSEHTKVDPHSSAVLARKYCARA